MSLAAPADSLAADSVRAFPTLADSLRVIQSPDSLHAKPRLVRVLPTVEVHALLGDLLSGQISHRIPAGALQFYPIDDLADVLALEPGVVAQAEELHVRGGRAGETMVTIDGLGLNEPERYRAMEVPLLALQSAELVSGALESPLGGGIAGVVQLRTANPTERPSAEWRWTGDGRLGTNYDRVAFRVSSPLRVLGLGVVAAGDGTFDDTWLPMLRTVRRHDVAGIPLGWRAENRMLGSIKLAPVEHPERYSAELFVSRQVHEPYSPSWSLDGWTVLPFNPKMSPIFSEEYSDSALRYRAADHLGITDERSLAALLSASAIRGTGRGTISLGLLSSRSVFSLGGNKEPLTAMHRPKYGNANDRDYFHVLWGDFPIYRQTASDVVTLRGDGEWVNRVGARFAAGAGLRYDVAALDQVNWLAFGRFGVDLYGPPPIDSIRSYRARAPGAFAYVQSRFKSGGLIVNVGLRAERFSPGAAGATQVLPGSTAGVWSFGPRVGIAYPISVRDVFSFSYVRIQQAPGRDYLYDNRYVISNREPLGNPTLTPATAISYEGALKHLISEQWALQSSVFYRDVFGQIGVEDFSTPAGPTDLRYTNTDQSSCLGFEWSLVHAVSDRLRLEGSYTVMQAWGNESRPGGDPYGPVRAANTPAIGDQPLSWDRRHTFLLSGFWREGERWSMGWATAVLSPLPWTPKPLRQPLTDIAQINSRRLPWNENTNVSVSWAVPRSRGLVLGIEARNLFDHRSDQVATVDGYPNPISNTLYDDYGAYRTETGLGGGAFWTTLPEGDPGHWVPVHDPRLMNPPRALRASIGAKW